MPSPVIDVKDELLLLIKAKIDNLLRIANAISFDTWRLNFVNIITGESIERRVQIEQQFPSEYLLEMVMREVMFLSREFFL